MALSDRHWIGAAIVACAIIAATKLPPQQEPKRRDVRPATEVLVQGRALDRVRRANAMLRVLSQRDSALALAARAVAPRPGAPKVIFGRDVPGALRTRLDSVLQRELAGLRATLAVAPVVVLVIMDSARGPHETPLTRGNTRWIETSYVLPAASDGRTCISIVEIGDQAIAARPETRRDGRPVLDVVVERLAGTLLGPCAYFGAHGLPGARIAAWLERTQYMPILRAPAAEAAWLRLGSIYPFVTETAVDRFLRRAGWSMDRTLVETDVVACVEGSDDRCLSALAANSDSTPGFARVLPILTSRGPVRAWATPRQPSPLGHAAPWLGASLHDQAGPEAFGHFWRSDLGPEQAWASAAGVPLSVATRSWMAETYDLGQGRRWPHPLAAGLQLAVAAGALGAGVVMRRRRTVAA
jgi:hypothetical protein